MDRRKFIQKSSFLSASALFNLQCMVSKYNEVGEIGLQLWSLRHAMDKNPLSTLWTLSKIGFQDVECVAYDNGKYYGIERSEFKNILEDLGLKMNSCHTRKGARNPAQNRTMSNDWEGACEDAAEMGQRSIICGYLEESERKTIDDYKRLA